MILVDLYVPSLVSSYEFRLDEKAEIGTIIRNMVELICQKEHCEFKGNAENLSLCTYRKETMLAKDSTLSDNGIRDGEKLILI